MLEQAEKYRDKTFFQFWKSERLPFLMVPPILFAVVVGSGILINYFQQGKGDWGAAVFLLGTVLIGYIIYYYVMYRAYRKGHFAYHAIDGNKHVLRDIKLSSSNANTMCLKKQKLLDKGLDVPIYEFTKADIILTDYSIILLGKPYSFTNIKYVSPLELMLNHQYTPSVTNRAKIVKYENKPNRVILYVNVNSYKKTIKMYIKSNTDIIQQWLITNNF